MNETNNFKEEYDEAQKGKEIMSEEKSCQNCKFYDGYCDSFKCGESFSLWDSIAPVPEKDNVNHPTHYTQGKIEVIEVIEDWELNYLEGNIIKYVARYKYKNKIEDLKKAEWYLKRLIKGMIDAN